MRLVMCVLVLFAISGALAQAPNPNVPYVLTISAPNTSIVVGEPVEVQVRFENVSQKASRIVKSGASEMGELTYDVEVVTTTGASVPLTPYGRALHGLPNTPPILIRNSPREVTLKPHQKVVDTVRLEKIYQLNPGSYLVRVRKTSMTDDPEPDIVSNTLRLQSWRVARPSPSDPSGISWVAAGAPFQRRK